jgi:uncharacterized membrane protein YhhN
VNALIVLSLLAAVSGALHIRSEYRGPRALGYVCKPLTTTALIAIACLAPGSPPAPYRELIVLGLIFSLAGDIFLMLPSDRFLPGLASFLVAHLLYIAAFSQGAGFQLSPLALAPFALASAALLRLLWPQLAGMKLPVTLYVVVIVTMGWQAAAQWSSVGETWALLALVGAILFTLSDAALALNRFRAPFAAAQATILTSYYLAQWLIALSVSR